MPKLPVETRWLRAGVSAPPVAVDREANVLRGYVLAQQGPFKSQGRGEFDEEALRSIVSLGNARPKGLKSRFTHPGLSEDGLGSYLGRAKNLRMDKARDDRTGKTVLAVRGDLHFSPSASKSPKGDLSGYVMDLAEDDADALSSSLVLEVDQEFRIDSKNRPLLDDDGNELPPLWRPKRLHASDIVDTGDAVDGLLSFGVDALDLPDGAVRMATAALDRAFPNAGRDVIEARVTAWLSRYLMQRFGAPVTPVTPRLDALRVRLKEAELQLMRGK